MGYTDPMLNNEQIELLANDVIAWGGVDGRPDPSADQLVSDWVEWACDEHDRDYDDELKAEAAQLKAVLVRRGLRSE